MKRKKKIKTQTKKKKKIGKGVFAFPEHRNFYLHTKINTHYLKVFYNAKLYELFIICHIKFSIIYLSFFYWNLIISDTNHLENVVHLITQI